MTPMYAPEARAARVAPCPVCRGLECMCRPRYFSGQLLTEGDLNAEQQYVVRKNQLHNLYLHGWGVVCGLTVTCHPSCAGWVRIGEGYAISPCGDDIVVCEPADVDVLARVEECLRAHRAADPYDCEPRGGGRTGCDTDGTWCLSLTYEETATRAITALRRPPEAVPCTCRTGTCGSGSCGCG